VNHGEHNVRAVAMRDKEQLRSSWTHQSVACACEARVTPVTASAPAAAPRRDTMSRVRHSESIEWVRSYYDALGEQEWDRLTATVRGRVSLEVHQRFLRRFVRPGWRVLEVGAGPGRFTFELAAIGAKVVVTDVSDVQLGLNEARLGGTNAERCVERRELLDVCDLSRYADAEFDGVLAFGGPLSYAFERTDEAVRGLLRVIRPEGVVVASVMSLLGTWRHFLPAITALSEIVGEEATDNALRTGDLRYVVNDAGDHICQLFRWSDLEALLARVGGRIVDGSASNWASLADADLLAVLEADAEGWSGFIGHEVAACGQTGARDGGTHILFAAQQDDVAPAPAVG
jgi:SAM-dependent methyltransferase